MNELKTEFISFYTLSIRLGVEQYVLKYWCDEFKIPRERNKVLAIYENTLDIIKNCLRVERISIAEAKKRLK